MNRKREEVNFLLRILDSNGRVEVDIDACQNYGDLYVKENDKSVFLYFALLLACIREDMNCEPNVK